MLAAKALLRGDKRDEAVAQLGAAHRASSSVSPSERDVQLECNILWMERDLFLASGKENRARLTSCALPSDEAPASPMLVRAGTPTSALLAAGKFADALKSMRADSSTAGTRVVLEGLARADAECLQDPVSASEALAAALDGRLAAAGETYRRAARALLSGDDILLSRRELIRMGARFDAPTRALMWRVAHAVQAAGLTMRAYDHARSGALAVALDEITLADKVSPELVARSSLKQAIARARVLSLVRSGARLSAAGNTDLAYAYHLAALRVSGRVPELMTWLARHEETLRSHIVRRVRLRPIGNIDTSLRSAFEAAVRKRLPRYLQPVADDRLADIEILYTVRGPHRELHGRVESHHKQVVAFEIIIPNPDYADAQQKYNEAVDELASAQEQYQILHNGANNMANQARGGGIIGVLAAASAGAEEISGVKILNDAKEKLAQARNQLNSTRRTKREPKLVDATYPSIVVDEKATSEFVLRIQERGAASIERVVPLTATATVAQTPPSEAIGVAGSGGGIGALAQLAPDLVSHADELGRRAAALVRAAQEDRLWSMAVAAVQAGNIEDAALAYVDFLHAQSMDQQRKQEALRYIMRSLP